MTEEEIWEQQQMRKAEERRQEDAEMERLEQERLARAERSPTLTDAEREAISRVYDLLCDRARELQSATRLDEARPLIQWAKTLQGLWERAT